MMRWIATILYCFAILLIPSKAIACTAFQLKALDGSLIYNSTCSSGKYRILGKGADY
jgi:hypothetical protein